MKLPHVDSSILGQGSVSRDLSADVAFVRAEGVAMGPEARDAALASAKAETAALAA